MDGSVKNLLEAEREAQKIITAAETERAAKLEAAQTEAQQRINVVEQGLEQKAEEQKAEVSILLMLAAKISSKLRSYITLVIYLL